MARTASRREILVPVERFIRAFAEKSSTARSLITVLLSILSTEPVLGAELPFIEALAALPIIPKKINIDISIAIRHPRREPRTIFQKVTQYNKCKV